MAEPLKPQQTVAEFMDRPFLRNLHKEIDRVFDRFRDGDGISGHDLLSWAREGAMPALDIAETDTRIEVTAELPGVSEEDLDVTVQGDTLILKGEKSSDREDAAKEYHLVERRYGSFRRVVPLGFTPEPDKVQATFADGVLSLRIEKPAEATAKTHKIALTKA